MSKTLPLILLASLLLTGCVPAAFVAGAAAGGAVIYDKRSLKTMTQDSQTTFDTTSQIEQNPQFKGAHIVVATFNHIVLLTGQAPTQELSQQAYTEVAAFPHVKRVYNEITVGPATSNMQRSKDTWITTKIKTAMLAEKGLQSSQIKVVTENNVVYLMGMVTRSQGHLAALVASKISGVQQVVKLFEYLN
jgi:osmotically-inducible protein OsmY